MSALLIFNSCSTERKKQLDSPNMTLAALHLHKGRPEQLEVVVPEGSERHVVINKEKYIYAQQKLEEEEEVATG